MIRGPYLLEEKRGYQARILKESCSGLNSFCGLELFASLNSDSRFLALLLSCWLSSSALNGTQRLNFASLWLSAVWSHCQYALLSRRWHMCVRPGGRPASAPDSFLVRKNCCLWLSLSPTSSTLFRSGVWESYLSQQFLKKHSAVLMSALSPTSLG